MNALPGWQAAKALCAWLFKMLRRHRPALAGFVLLALMAGLAFLGPVFTPYTAADVSGPYLDPGGKHWLGTDSQGYDLFTRLIYGARTTLLIALAATVLSMALGSLIGAVAGFCGRWVDTLLMRLVDFAMSFPAFLLAVVIVAILGKNLDNLILAVGLVGAPVFARQVRAEILRVMSMEYMAAASALGLPASRALFAHALPNSLNPIIVLSTLGMGGAILEVAALNFLGLGGDPYQVPEWGLILKQGWDEADKGTVQVAAAGLAIFVTVLGFNLFGDGLRDELDPRAKRR
ncbi:MAG: ABC transporter permease [Planctomycetes bacterium]|nr:ABC transporter permease [Planctomycetota bacterium]NUQ35805.1 ABC transporter permease [Planctomycetaceae bacterium]